MEFREILVIGPKDYGNVLSNLVHRTEKGDCIIFWKDYKHYVIHYGRFIEFNKVWLMLRRNGYTLKRGRR